MKASELVPGDVFTFEDTGGVFVLFSSVPDNLAHTGKVCAIVIVPVDDVNAIDAFCKIIMLPEWEVKLLNF